MLAEEFYSETSDSSSDEDFEEVDSEGDSESGNGCDNVPLFYSAVESSIMEVGIPSAEDFKEHEFGNLEENVARNELLKKNEQQNFYNLIKEYE
ncbi:hypothetical protein AYI69_g4580 [Smittium culicis]|uniref:Uncharacterized protein n=1 Tax=Smittium culicis TaxID=133412 RepID=A0A1R1YCD9_9FUNG|nr:hypothetical protein AYI69_g4580 [Smittium culicis]